MFNFKKKNQESQETALVVNENVHDHPEKLFIGVRTHINTKTGNNAAQVKAVWEKLSSDGTLEKMRAMAAEGAEGFVALCTDFEARAYDYWISVELGDENAEAPEGMEKLRVPAGEYASFTCTGPAHEAVAKEWEFIYNKWFPKSGLNHAQRAELEIYPFGDMEAEDYASEIRVPVEPMPERKIRDRTDYLGALPYIAIGGLIGTLVTAQSEQYLIGVLVGGAGGYFLYGYIKKRKEDKREREAGEDEDK